MDQTTMQVAKQNPQITLNSSPVMPLIMVSPPW
jgi:hypothetical protein